MQQPSTLKIPVNHGSLSSPSLLSPDMDSASTLTADKTSTDEDMSPNTPVPQSPDSVRDTFHLPRQPPRRAQPGRALGNNVASVMLDAPSSKGPYGMSASSSVASLSHGNLLETASMTSSALESASEAGDDGTALTSGSLPRGGIDPARDRKASRHARLQNMISRSRSTKKELAQQEKTPQDKNKPAKGSRDHKLWDSRPREREDVFEESPQTAPMSPDRAFERAMDSSKRNRSAERARSAIDEPDIRSATGQGQGQGTGRFANFFASSTKVAGDLGRVSQRAAGDLGRVTQKVGGDLGKSGKGLFGKMARSGSSSEQDMQPDKYQLKLINRPLIEQTRMTRLQKRMADAKDKTEFWMPALPYRCIDYLNSKGVETEGLYRIPGAVKDIKYWQMRFDQGEDIDLLDTDLEDVHTVGSILKAWLRELPDELLPKETQSRVARECATSAGGTDAPQMLKDELSKLPPFHYYLLFAVTAHVALLSKFSDVNKMTFNNLCICFQPCLNIDAFSFHFLVKDWRNCWQGCWTEKAFLEEEYRVMEGITPSPQSPLYPPPPLKHRDSATSSPSMTSRPKTSGAALKASETERRVPTTSPSEQPNGSRVSVTEQNSRVAPETSPQSQSGPATPPLELANIASVSPMRM